MVSIHFVKVSAKFCIMFIVSHCCVDCLFNIFRCNLRHTGYCSENGLQSNHSSNGIDIQALLEGLSSISTHSKSPKRVIKLPIFPEDYDKTIMPPKENGKKLTFSI